MTRPPTVRVLVAAVAVPTAAVLAAIALTAPADPDPAGHRFDGLVLDGSGVTTTAPVGNLPDPVDPIPHRTIEGADDHG